MLARITKALSTRTARALARALPMLAIPLAIGSCGQATPDERGLVFIRRVGESNEVFHVRLANGAERAVTQTPDLQERWPYWSDAAGRLVYQAAAAEGEPSDLWLWDPNGSAPAPWRVTARRDERWPVWSPDGRRLVFAFRGGRPPAGITSVPLEGGDAWVMAFSGPDDFFFRPSFAPDGERMVAQRRGPQGIGSHLWILAPRELPRQLTSDPAFFDMKPWFTRSGDEVVFSRRPIDGEARDVAMVAARGGEVRTLASTDESDDHSARPSPTRDEIALCSNRGGYHQILLSDLTGDRVRTLKGWSDRDAFAPRWSPDGEHLVVTAMPRGATIEQRTREAHIVVIDREGRVLLDIPGLMPDWMPAWP